MDYRHQEQNAENKQRWAQQNKNKNFANRKNKVQQIITKTTKRNSPQIYRQATKLRNTYLTQLDLSPDTTLHKNREQIKNTTPQQRFQAYDNLYKDDLQKVKQ